MSAPTTTKEHRAWDGVQGFHQHDSPTCDGPMRFGLYLPPAALRGQRVPALYYLAGLTCTEETFAIKGGAQRLASELGLALVTCDTSPRAVRLPGDDESESFGLGAGFYLDATEPPWSAAYRMHSYVTAELPGIVENSWPIDRSRRGIFGHSMGGHGALVAALKNPGAYASVSAFAPVVAPSEVPWGKKAFARYLGPERRAWAGWDACALIAGGARVSGGPILVDQGTTDQFLNEQLQPQRLVEACAAAGQPLDLQMRDGYDHSYYFISTFMARHLHHHAHALDASPDGRG